MSVLYAQIIDIKSEPSLNGYFCNKTISLDWSPLVGSKHVSSSLRHYILLAIFSPRSEPAQLTRFRCSFVLL